MNEIAKQEPKITNLAPQTTNYFEAYGNSVVNRQIVGQLLKFSKGDWLAGQDAEEVPVGKKLVAMMETLSIGWIRWADNKPDQQLMGLVTEGFRPARRSELGDQDESTWEVDTSGKARDPWQFSNYLILKEPGADAEDDEKLFTFATSSTGGLNALGELAKTYGKGMRQKPGEYPIVALQVDSYVHPNKEFGRIKIPVFEVVGWEKGPSAPAAAAAPKAEPKKAEAKPRKK